VSTGIIRISPRTSQLHSTNLHHLSYRSNCWWRQHTISQIPS